MDKSYLDYFKDLLEGKTDTMIRIFLKKNDIDLRRCLPRAQYLRLKFAPFDEIPVILNENNINYSINHNAIKRQRYLFSFDLSVFDDSGKMKESHIRGIFGGSINEFNLKDLPSAKKCLLKYIGFPNRVNTDHALERAEDILFFSEIELVYGNFELGVFLLKILADIDTQYSRVDDVVLRAKQTLTGVSGS